ncbi:3-oxoacyl-ACP synthase III family protein [Agrobacterium pusense]|uniref:Ketoacyl-ACP synthase III n=1 Tax=Agrobacterium pusense TaxID=648995 RepID=A0AA44EGW7_9HYPH|nr:ketoacyl-ACP synthase III [Agrobacterium pusense]NRF07768.1 ketoacyl-ACP synthase III [Agrobacterium pusense]NRF18065.1 ketoacyl-ACP synthase III [Agrobacterium pusense]
MELTRKWQESPVDQTFRPRAVKSSEGNVRIISSGHSVPVKILSNAALSTSSPIDAEWVERKLGIRERRIVESSETTSDLAFRACKQALELGDVAEGSVDLLIVATATPDKQAPSTACILSAKLGLCRAAAFDVSAVCCGFIYALATASLFLKSGAANRVLVVGADTFSRVTDWNSQDSAFFGDGAGAIILERGGETHGRFVFSLTADTQGVDCFAIPARGTFEMDGRGVYKFARRLIRESVSDVLSIAGVSSNEIASVIPHQASLTLLRDVSGDIGVSLDKFHLNMNRLANTAGGTVPIAFSEAWQDNAFKAEDWTLFFAAGAGMTAGAALYQWS